MSSSLRPYGLQHTRLPSSPSFTISQSVLELASIESVMPSNHLTSPVVRANFILRRLKDIFNYKTTMHSLRTKLNSMGFPDGLMGKKSACNAGDPGDTGSISGSGRFPGGGNGSPLQYSLLKNPMDRGTWAGYSPKSHKELAQLRH